MLDEQCDKDGKDVRKYLMDYAIFWQLKCIPCTWYYEKE
jgi:hypothetical protein